jgi:hypothetical protein
VPHQSGVLRARSVRRDTSKSEEDSSSLFPCACARREISIIVELDSIWVESAVGRALSGELYSVFQLYSKWHTIESGIEYSQIMTMADSIGNELVSRLFGTMS